MRIMLACLMSILTTSALRADFTAQQQGCTSSAKLGPLTLKHCDVSFAKTPKYVTVMWDSMPYQTQLKFLSSTAIADIAQALALDWGAQRYPVAKVFRVVMVEVKERDSYGLPRWDQLKVLQRFEFKKSSKKQRSSKK